MVPSEGHERHDLMILPLNARSPDIPKGEMFASCGGAQFWSNSSKLS